MCVRRVVVSSAPLLALVCCCSILEIAVWSITSQRNTLRCLPLEAKNPCFFSAACTKLHRPVSSSSTSYTIRAVADCSRPRHDGYKSEVNRSCALFSFHIRQTQTANKSSFIPPSIQTSSFRITFIQGPHTLDPHTRPLEAVAYLEQFTDS